MTAASSEPRSKWNLTQMLKVGPFLAGTLMVGAGLSIAAMSFPFPSDDAARRLCDQAVAALVRSKDSVEVERAGIIIHELNCEISRRLTEIEKLAK